MQLRPSHRANLPNPLQALLKQLPDEEKDEARDRAHAAGIWQQPESWEATFQKLPPTSSGYQLFLEVVRSRAAERICRISMCAWLAKSIWT